MIVGVGLDIVDLDRVERIIRQPSGLRFAERVLTKREMERYLSLGERRGVEYLAGRFAAKESVAKALGCGIGAAVGFVDIEIGSDQAGRPICTLSEASWSRLGRVGAHYRIHVAITHERKMAASTAVIEYVGGNGEPVCQQPTTQS
jgi:holo-[acyl-carrier protein] synthase